jgi:anti-sigma28 factor (negative regulator of flagellin synthesis)
MRIQSDVVGAPSNTGNAQPVDRNSSQSRSPGESTSGDTDIVNLSAASYLLAQAKSLPSSSRQTNIDSIAAQVRGGTYSADIGQLTKSLVQDHIQS